MNSMSTELQALLKAVLLKHSPDLIAVVSNNNLSTLNDDERNRIIQLVSLEFSETGLESDDEPNPRGLALEELLDALNRDRISKP